ncbi:MAG: four helix bundle protein [Tannerella sp.]|jgi:four helix bundle protein|nr:four helix bundle protein [Tannerella sp.]
MESNAVKEKSFSFAVRIVKLYQPLCEDRKEYALAKQLLHSATSMKANVREAFNADSI